jgi:hypothetical protein
MAVVRSKQGFHGSVASSRFVIESQGRERHLSLELLTEKTRKVRHLRVAGGTARCPLPHLRSAVARLAAFPETPLQ